MGSLAQSAHLSSSLTLSQHCNATTALHHSCRTFLQIPSKAKNPNFRINLHSHSNASLTRTLGGTCKDFPLRVSAPLGQCRAYIRAEQTPQMAQRSAEAEVMGLLLRERIIFLGNEIDDFVADAIIGQLLLLDARNPNKDIRLFINCSGGSTSAAMAIFDALQFCKADISTVAFGIAASTASLILAGGTRGKRLSMPNARIMVHQPMGGARGDTTNVEIQAQEIINQKKSVIRIFSEITGRPANQVEKDLDRDRYMSPLEAMEFGIIDGVINQDSMLPPTYLPETTEPRPDLLLLAKDPEKFFHVEVPDDEIY